MNKKYLYLFADLDGTLIETLSGETFPKGIWDMKFKFDVLDAIKKMNPKIILIASNQGGIELGYLTNEEFQAKRQYICKSIEAYCEIPCFGTYCDSNDPKCFNRKPNIGMIQTLASICLGASLEDIVKDSLMIGDASGKEGQFSASDKNTATNCGMEYMDVQDFCKQYLVTE